MNHFKKVTQASCIAIFASLSASLPAQANKITFNDVTNPSKPITIKVYSIDGETWGEVDTNETYSIGLEGSFVCQWGKNNKSKAYEFKYSYDDLERVSKLNPDPYSWKENIWSDFRYKPQPGGFDAKAVCEAETQKVLAQNPDKTRYHIMAETRSVFVEDAISGNFTAYCHPVGIGFTDLKQTDIAVNVKVDCQGSALAESKIPQPEPEPVEPVEMKLVDLVTDAKFYAKDDTIVGSCPANIALTGWVKFSRPGTVKYRYVSQGGKASPTFTMTAEKSGRLLVREWNTVLKKSEDTPKRANSEDMPDPNILKSWHKMEFVEPEGMSTLTANYSAVCTQEMQITLPESDNPERNLRKRPGRAKFGDDGN